MVKQNRNGGWDTYLVSHAALMQHSLVPLSHSLPALLGSIQVVTKHWPMAEERAMQSLALRSNWESNSQCCSGLWLLRAVCQAFEGCYVALEGRICVWVTCTTHRCLHIVRQPLMILDLDVH